MPSDLVEKPTKPALPFHPRDVPKLVDGVIVTQRIVPWRARVLSTAAAVPPWSLSLELFYRMFHQSTWPYLEAMEAAYYAYHTAMVVWWRQQTRVGASREELDAVCARIEAVLRDVGLLYEGIYGLHRIRQTYLEQYRPFVPGWDDKRIITETLELEYAVNGAPWLLWPLPLPTPPSQRRRYVRLVDLSAEALKQYLIPAFDSHYPRLFSPPTLEEVSAKHAASPEGRLRSCVIPWRRDG
ncbi:hypothetical protein JCM10207_003083 [Rhodosporidiobolus poonsookiae]